MKKTEDIKSLPSFKKWAIFDEIIDEIGEELDSTGRADINIFDPDAVAEERDRRIKEGIRLLQEKLKERGLSNR